MDIVDRIDVLAKKKKWPRSEVFRQLGINPTAAIDWRKGKSSPDRHLPQIAEILETTEEYLRGETDNPQKDQKYALSPQQVEMMMRALQSRGLLNPDGTLNEAKFSVYDAVLAGLNKLAGESKDN